MRPEAEASCHLGGDEGTVGARVASDQVAQGVAHGMEKRLRQSGRGRDAERVAVAASILRRHPARLAGHLQRDHASGPGELAEPDARRGGRRHPRCDLWFGEVAELQKQVVHAVRVAGRALRPQVLQGPLEAIERLAVDQLAQLDVTQQLAKLRRVHGKRLGPALGQRRVALVEEVRDVAEHQRGGKRRWRLAVHRNHPDAPAPNVAQEPDQGRHVEGVAQALAVRLENDGEGVVPPDDAQKVGSALALLPQGQPLARAAPRQQQGPRRRLPEPGGEQRHRLRSLPRRAGGAPDAELPDHQRLHLVRVRQHRFDGRWLVGLRESRHDAVVSPEDIVVHLAAGLRHRRDRHGPRGVHAPAERAQHADAPVAHLIPVALDEDGPVVRDGAGRALLVLEIRPEVSGGRVAEIVAARELLQGRSFRSGPEGAGQLPDGPPQLDTAAGGVAVPERHLPRLPRRRRHEHAIVRDLLDTPRAGAEEEGLALAALEDHLLVQLAHPPMPPRLPGDEDGIEAAVGDGATVGDGDGAGALSRVQGGGQTVPGDARPEVGELVGGIAPGEHVEHALEQRSRELGEGRRPPHQPLQPLHRPVLDRHHGHHLLRQDVERVPGIGDGLHLSLAHPRGKSRAGEQVAPVLRQDHALRRRVEVMAGAPDTLERAHHAGWGLHVDHEVNGPHVDAQLE
jgi:hypothetical protein